MAGRGRDLTHPTSRIRTTARTTFRMVSSPPLLVPLVPPPSSTRASHVAFHARGVKRNPPPCGIRQTLRCRCSRRGKQAGSAGVSAGGHPVTFRNRTSLRRPVPNVPPRAQGVTPSPSKADRESGHMLSQISHEASRNVRAGPARREVETSLREGAERDLLRSGARFKEDPRLSQGEHQHTTASDPVLGCCFIPS